MTFYDQLRAAAIALGAQWCEEERAINIVGVRNTDEVNANKFNDLICVAYTSHKFGHSVLICEASTDPGLYWRNNLANVKGTAILPRGHYKRLWRIGKHQGKYTALVQLSPVAVWRDANRDSKIETGTVLDTGMHGIALHRAGEFVKSILVDKWSAGCQVVAAPNEFAQLMNLAHGHAEKFANAFDYTLLHDVDVGLNWGSK